MQDNLKTESDPDIIKDSKAVISGMSNFYFGLKTKLARERLANHCGACKYNIEEPLPDMKIKDSAIPELSGRSCGFCGCILSFKTRQSVKKCIYWK